MTTNQQRIKEIETRWWRLVTQRQHHYNEVLSGIDKRLWVATIDGLNAKAEYEQKFDEMEEELRKLDPDHHYLAEKQLDFDC